MKISRPNKKKIFKLFAQGCSPGYAAEIFDGSSHGSGNSTITVAQAEKLFEDYLALPLWEKLQLTLAADSASIRQHRLIDDIADLRRLDDLLDCADPKMMMSLLDLKRKIKERMVKECSLETDQSATMTDEQIEEFDRVYEKVFGFPPPQK